MTSTSRIKVTSRSFQGILLKGTETLFPNSVFNQDGPETGIPDLEQFLQMRMV